ncbi:PREDICTED: protein XRI1-like isoform X2 [Nicotiana attenuata]|uniref:protein XRI1-like isoform X2 n=1 Tax=Nicotiana attenuata TaxID=49451 RepID=UPI0009056992|nr:PREDICTED: protein XRI1-like isoform X2 [Nicotiana attenuata]
MVMPDLPMDFDTNSGEIWGWQCGETFLEDRENFDVTTKKLEQCREPAKAVKRRRMLQFDAEILDVSGSNEEIPLTCLKSKERDAYFEEAICEVSDWLSEYADGATSSAHEGLDESSEEWLTDCFNDAELQPSSEDMNTSGVPDVQADIIEVINSSPERETTMVKSSPVRTCGNIIFKGSNSYMQPPKKGASSVVYPFGFIKPCSVQGDLTLKEINKKIHTPPPSKSKQSNQDPPSYPTSAFSGKPVVGKTKINIEGGRGSITIMRTKG